MSADNEVRLASETQVPPGGWRYHCAATKWDLPGPFSGSLDSKVAVVVSHHRANPGRGLTVDHDECRKLILGHTIANVQGMGPSAAHALVNAPKISAPSEEQPTGLLETFRAGVRSVANDSKALGLLAEWVGEGGVPVAQVVADKRASICAGCPKNDKKKRRVAATVAEAVKFAAEFMSHTKMATPLDGFLGTCAECGCHLKTKVWTPTRYLSVKEDEEFPPNCWMLTEEPTRKRLNGLFDSSQYAYRQDIPEPPPFDMQVPWRTGVFDLRQGPSAYWFNPGMMLFNGRLLLAPRKMVWPEYKATIAFAYLDGDMKLAGELKPVEYTPQYADEHMEDGRLFEDPEDPKKGFYMAASNFFRSSKQHQALFKVGADFKVKKAIRIAYGGNANDIANQVATEKNWQFFFHEKRLHFVHWIGPRHTVVPVVEGVAMKEHITRTTLQWPFGRMSGGTPPVRIGDLYWSFFHSFQDNGKTKRYFMGAYAFSAGPPFEVRYITPKPLMVGTGAHPVALWMHKVVFPTGAVYDEASGEWIVSLGLNDCICAWVRIPHADIVHLIQ